MRVVSEIEKEWGFDVIYNPEFIFFFIPSLSANYIFHE
jgi:hypothetical protein